MRVVGRPYNYRWPGAVHQLAWPWSERARCYLLDGVGWVSVQTLGRSREAVQNFSRRRLLRSARGPLLRIARRCVGPQKFARIRHHTFRIVSVR